MGIAGAFGRLQADDDIVWSPIDHGLRIGLHLEKTLPHGALIVYLQNTAATALDLFITDGEIPRLQFTAISSDQKRYEVEDRLRYIPLGCCCCQPFTQRLAPGATQKWSYEFNRLLDVPFRSVSLGKLLERGCSLQVSFEVTRQDLKTVQLSLDDLWLGHVVSAAVRTR